MKIRTHKIFWNYYELHTSKRNTMKIAKNDGEKKLFFGEKYYQSGSAPPVLFLLKSALYYNISHFPTQCLLPLSYCGE